MSKLQELIQKLCPYGVEYKKISECFDVYNGMTGVSLKWKESGNCKFIDYLNTYQNLKIDVSKKPFATVKNLNQNTVRQTDILLTTASEVSEECAISSVVEDEIEDNVFLDDHLFGLHLKEEYKGLVNTTYINYYMKTPAFKRDVKKKVKGVTAFSCFWSILELFQQKKRVEKGWFPANPKHLERYKNLNLGGEK